MAKLVGITGNVRRITVLEPVAGGRFEPIVIHSARKSGGKAKGRKVRGGKSRSCIERELERAAASVETGARDYRRRQERSNADGIGLLELPINLWRAKGTALRSYWS